MAFCVNSSRLFLAVLCALLDAASANLSTCESIDGWLNCTLRVEATTWHLPFKNISFRTRVYNGQSPGPLIRGAPGDRVRLLVQNRLGSNRGSEGCKAPVAHYRGANITNLHVHGIYDSPAHDNTFLCIEPQEDQIYSYTLDDRMGTSLFLYHPHYDGSSGMQMLGGMAGAFEVRDPDQESFFEFDTTRVLVLQSLHFDPASKDYIGDSMSYGGTSSLPLDLHNPEDYRGVLVLANGEFEPTSSVKVGKYIRLKLLNALASSQSALMNIGMIQGSDSCTFHVLALDGVYLKHPRKQPSMIIPSGGRADVAISCYFPGQYSLGTVMAGSENMGGMLEVGHTILHLHVSQPDGTLQFQKLPSALPGPPTFYEDLMDAQPEGHNSILLGNVAGDNIVNGWPYNGGVSYTMQQGSIQEWRLLGGEGQGLEKVHPYHQHMAHFQILNTSLNTNGLVATPGDYRDTVPLFRDLNFTVRFRVPPFLGLMMVHCHILKHEDLGMMTLVNVTEAPTVVAPRHGPLRDLLFL